MDFWSRNLWLQQSCQTTENADQGLQHGLHTRRKTTVHGAVLKLPHDSLNELKKLLIHPGGYTDHMQKAIADQAVCKALRNNLSLMLQKWNRFAVRSGMVRPWKSQTSYVLKIHIKKLFFQSSVLKDSGCSGSGWSITIKITWMNLVKNDGIGQWKLGFTDVSDRHMQERICFGLVVFSFGPAQRNSINGYWCNTFGLMSPSKLWE